MMKCVRTLRSEALLACLTAPKAASLSYCFCESHGEELQDFQTEGSADQEDRIYWQCVT